MCLSPAPAAALRWLAATPRAQHVAGKGPVSPATPGKGHGWVRAPGHGSPPAVGHGQGAAAPRALPVSGSQGRVNSGSCHRWSLGAISVAIASGRFRSICLVAGKSALALRIPKVFTKGREKGQGIKRHPEEVSLRTQLSPPSEADLLSRLEAVLFLGRLPEPELNPAAKLTRPTRARSIFNSHKHCSQLQPFASPCVCFHRGKAHSNPAANLTPPSDGEPPGLIYRRPFFFSPLSKSPLPPPPERTRRDRPKLV